jgi:hypothetical protein
MAHDGQRTRHPMEPRVPEYAADQPAWWRLQDQLHWYDTKSQHSQRWYKRLKLGQVTLAILIPVMSLLRPEYSKWATALAGTLIALLEAIQQLNQYSTLWVTYRSTAEHLKHEQFLFLSAGGPYRGLPEPERLVRLAERVEEHVSNEHANWFSETGRATSTEKKDPPVEAKELEHS